MNQQAGRRAPVALITGGRRGLGRGIAWAMAAAGFDILLAMRERLNAAAPKDADGNPLWKLSINDFIIRAMGAALQKVPAANVTWAGDSVDRKSTRLNSSH